MCMHQRLFCFLDHLVWLADPLPIWVKSSSALLRRYSLSSFGHQRAALEEVFTLLAEH